jgi:hypothetical protein
MKIKSLILENTWLPRLTDFGWGNGYILIPEGHPLHGKHYDDIDVEVHGGLTFSEKASDLTHWKEIKEEDRKSWVIGFDTCHCDDNSENWNKEKVRKETNKLLKQLKKLSKLNESSN